MNTITIKRTKFSEQYSQLQPWQLKQLRKYLPGRTSFYREMLTENPELELTLDLNKLNK